MEYTLDTKNAAGETRRLVIANHGDDIAVRVVNPDSGIYEEALIGLDSVDAVFDALERIDDQDARSGQEPSADAVVIDDDPIDLDGGA